MDFENSDQPRLYEVLLAAAKADTNARERCDPAGAVNRAYGIALHAARAQMGRDYRAVREQLLRELTDLWVLPVQRNQ